MKTYEEYRQEYALKKKEANEKRDWSLTRRIKKASEKNRGGALWENISRAILPI